MHDLMPIEPVILTRTYLEVQSGPLPINCILDRNVIARGYHVSAVDIALGNIAVEQHFGGGNQFQCHYYHSQWNIHLKTIELDPYSH